MIQYIQSDCLVYLVVLLYLTPTELNIRKGSGKTISPVQNKNKRSRSFLQWAVGNQLPESKTFNVHSRLQIEDNTNDLTKPNDVPTRQ